MDLFYYPSLNSTQDEAKRLILEGKTESCVISEEQKAGRGTQGRKWVSNKDSGLYLSVVINFGNNIYDGQEKNLTELCKKITEEVTLVLKEEITIAFSLAPEKLYIKPINDLYCDSKKLAGVLVEHIVFKENSFFIIGIGLNLKKIETNGSFEAISLEEILNKESNLDKRKFSLSLAKKLKDRLKMK